MIDTPNGRNGLKDTVRSAEEVASHKPQIVDHEARARERIAQFRAEHGDGDFSEVYVDKWFAQAPPGWTYEWKTNSVWGKEYPQYVASLQRTGWSPVPAHRHRELLYPEYDAENVIIDGMLLVERPKELTDRVRRQEYARAIEVVRSSERKLAEAPAGTAPRTAHAETVPRVRGHVGPVSISD
jgi:hypothetical protein